jgi:hypothetical protein
VRGFRGVDHSNDYQLDPRRQHFEQSSPAAEQHRNLVDLQLVENACHKCGLRRVSAMDQNVAVTCGSLRLRHRAGDPIRHIGHQWIFRALLTDPWVGLAS